MRSLRVCARTRCDNVGSGERRATGDTNMFAGYCARVCVSIGGLGCVEHVRENDKIRFNIASSDGSEWLESYAVTTFNGSVAATNAVIIVLYVCVVDILENSKSMYCRTQLTCSSEKRH